jgi:hypothetical protein
VDPAIAVRRRIDILARPDTLRRTAVRQVVARLQTQAAALVA